MKLIKDAQVVQSNVNAEQKSGPENIEVDDNGIPDELARDDDGQMAVESDAKSSRGTDKHADGPEDSDLCDDSFAFDFCEPTPDVVLTFDSLPEPSRSSQDVSGGGPDHVPKTTSGPDGERGQPSDTVDELLRRWTTISVPQT